MSELTPERIRDAAEVLRLLDCARPPFGPDYAWLPGQVEARANELEAELKAAEARREKRVEGLAREVWTAREMWVRGDGRTGGFDPLCRSVQWSFHIARDLLDRYPALAEQIREDHP